MSYHCERCGAHLGDLATQCGCDLPPTKAEIDRARIGHATPILDTLRAELARVKAESLRVVPIDQHELTHWEVAMAVFLNGATTIYERYDSDEGKLVRLERWEDE